VSRVLRPRQARYQAALRPDRLWRLIIRDLPTQKFSNRLIRASTVLGLLQKEFIVPSLVKRGVNSSLTLL
jgi:hypothetical protein